MLWRTSSSTSPRKESQQHWHAFVVFIDLTLTTDHIDTSSPSSSTSAPTPIANYIYTSPLIA
jgi:hypothetical protein